MYDEGRATESDIFSIGYFMNINPNVEHFKAFEGVEECFGDEIAELSLSTLHILENGLKISDCVYINKNIIPHEDGDNERRIVISHDGILARYYRRQSDKRMQFIDLIKSVKHKERARSVVFSFGDSEPLVAFYDNSVILLLTNNPLRETTIDEVFSLDVGDISIFREIPDTPVAYPYCDVSRCNVTRKLIYSVPNERFILNLLCEYNVDTRKAVVTQLQFECYSHIQSTGIQLSYASSRVETLCATSHGALAALGEGGLSVRPVLGCGAAAELHIILPSSATASNVDGALVLAGPGWRRVGDPGPPVPWPLASPVAPARLRGDAFLLLAGRWALCRLAAL